jgi:RimJ/RimL family protein N-acetyltransferase
VWEENHKAQRVYEKLGYKIVGDHDFVIGGVIQTDHIMLKEL